MSLFPMLAKSVFDAAKMDLIQTPKLPAADTPEVASAKSGDSTKNAEVKSGKAAEIKSGGIESVLTGLYQSLQDASKNGSAAKISPFGEFDVDAWINKQATPDCVSGSLKKMIGTLFSVFGG